MKKLLLKSLVLLCALVVGNQCGWAATYVKVTSASDLVAGSNYVIAEVSDNTDYLVTGYGTKLTHTSSGFSISENTITTTTAIPLEFTLGTVTDGNNTYYTLKYSANDYLGYGSSTNFETATSTTNNKEQWIITPSPSDYRITNRSANTRYIARNSNSIGAYATSNSYPGCYLFKKQTSGKEEAGLSYSTVKYATTFGAAFSTPTLENPNSLAVTYSTSDATVADVNTTSGAITIKNKIGSAMITASTEGDATHDAGNASYTIYVFEHDGSAANNAYTVAEARIFISNGLFDADTQYYLNGIVYSVGTYNSTDKTLTYYISDNGESAGSMTVYQGKGLNGADFASANDMKAKDIVTLLGKFKLYNNTTPQITNTEQVYFKRKNAPELVAIADFDMYRETEMDAEDLFTITSTGSVSYGSSDEDVAKVEGGKLKALAVGTATITISVAANDDYNAGSDAVKVTIKNRDAVVPEGSSVGGFTKITSTAELTDGDYLIVCESQKVAFNGNLQTLDATSNYINVTITNNTIASSNETNNAIFTYDATEKTLLSKSGKYIGRTTNSNGLNTSTTTMTNTITFNGNGNAVITSSAGPALQYNKTSGQTRFRYFTGTQEDVQLYKKSTANSYDITIGSTGYKTLISAVSATLPAGLTAYKAVSAGKGKIQLTSVESIKAGSAYVLKGTASTDYTLTVTDTPEEPTGNILEVSTESTSNGVYVLSNGSSGVGFYKWMGGSLGAGRAIVPASAVTSGAHEFLGFDFDGETTAINNLTPSLSKGEGEYYDLQGRKVAQPTKGLHIVNGRKVIVK